MNLQSYIQSLPVTEDAKFCLFQLCGGGSGYTSIPEIEKILYYIDNNMRYRADMVVFECNDTTCSLNLHIMGRERLNKTNLFPKAEFRKIIADMLLCDDIEEEF